MVAAILLATAGCKSGDAGNKRAPQAAPVGGHSVELLSCTYDNAENSHDYFKPSGYAKDHEEPLGDHFPLFATFRLK